jgi:hypothetical protein
MLILVIVHSILFFYNNLKFYFIKPNFLLRLEYSLTSCIVGEHASRNKSQNIKSYKHNFWGTNKIQ